MVMFKISAGWVSNVCGAINNKKTTKNCKRQDNKEEKLKISNNKKINNNNNINNKKNTIKPSAKALTMI